MKRILITGILALLGAGRIVAVDLTWLSRSEAALNPEAGSFTRIQSQLELKVDQAFGARAAFSGRLRFTWRAPLDPTVRREEGSGELLPELRDAWLDIFDFIAKGITLRIGKQPLSLGKSDFFRHLDTVNPPDLSDPLRFDQRVPIWLLTIKYAIGFDAGVELFAGPGTERGLYPQGSNGMREQLPYLDAALGGGYLLTDALDTGTPGIHTAVCGSRIWFKLLGFDISLLAHTRLQTQPVAVGVAAITGTMTGTASFAQPREYHLGTALAGELFGLGVRGELLFRYHPGATTRLTVDGAPAGEYATIARGWDILWNAGLDYQFPGNGPSWNLEFSRGFPGEYRGSGSTGINHYLACTLEQKWDADRWKAGLTVGCEFDRLADGASWAEFRDGTALFTGTELHRMIGENLELTLGFFYLHAPAGSTLKGAGIGTLVWFSTEAKF